MSTVMNRAAFASLLVPGLYDVIALAYKEYPEIYSKFFDVRTSEKKYEENLEVEGFGAASEKPEGSSIAYNNLTQGYNRKWTHKTFAIGARVTREMYEDDLYKVFKQKLGKYIGRSIKQTWEILAANVLNNGFSANYTGAGQTEGDGVALFATNHPWKSGGTYSNRPGTDADLSHTALEAMITMADQAKDSGDVPIVLMPKTLVIPTGERWVAEVILGSQLKSGTANNDKNTLKDLSLDYVLNPYLTDVDAWFLTTDMNPLVFWERQRPIVEAEDDFDTKDAKITVYGRCSAGFESPQGIYGNPGA
jgi:hypothetical protein